MAAAGLPKLVRGRAILIGIAAATILRICFALITTQLLSLGGGLLIAGGVLLLWVCWKDRIVNSGQPHEVHLGEETITGTNPQCR